jgi:uncharacterized protein (DUF927 family)
MTAGAAQKKAQTIPIQCPEVLDYQWETDGLYFQSPRKGLTFIVESFEISGLASDSQGKNPHLILEFVDKKCRKHEVMIPTSMLGKPTELHAKLSENGMQLASNGAKHLAQYLSMAQIQMPCNMQLVYRCGWHENALMMPDGEVLGATESGELIKPFSNLLLNTDPAKGTLAGQKKLMELAKGNPFLIFSVCVALSAPLLKLMDVEGGGFNLVGKSGKGKSSALRLSYSIVGNPEPLMTWRSTDNGLEGKAAAHNDSFMVIDELGQADIKTLPNTIYMLANGVSKLRAYDNSQAQNLKTWRLVYLSSGEKTLDAILKGTQTGQDTRLVNIPIPENGLIKDLHGNESPAVLADYLNEQAKLHYGHIGREYARRLATELLNDADGFKAKLKTMLHDWLALIDEKYLSKGSTQLRRIAKRFAACAIGGQLASQWQLVPWSATEVIDACIVAIDAHFAKRGLHDGEDVKILEAVFEATQTRQDSFERDGYSGNIPNCLGRKRESRAVTDIGGAVIDQLWDFGFSASGLKAVCGYSDTKQITSVLRKHGWIETGKDGKSGKPGQVEGKRQRLYWISHETLEQYDIKQNG